MTTRITAVPEADPDWRTRAACRGEDPERWFPLGTSTADLIQAAEAKVICWNRCPVRLTCLRWAQDTGQDAGIWGGLDEDERRALKRRGAS